MANRRISANGKELVIVDAAPGADGYWTNPFTPRKTGNLSIEKVFFSVRHYTSTPTTAVPSLQFKGEDDGAWTDFNNDGTAFAVGDNKVIENNAMGISWRAGVKQGNFAGGAVILGFNW